jgi:NodT family efflux transporter outer membrane factor (OMF) lipoprotein
MAGCMVGPKYTKPSAVPATPAYKEPPPENFKEAGAWKPAQPSDAVIRGKWWGLFNDPQLNALEEQVEPSNQTLKIAVAHYQEARAAIRFNRASLFPTITAGPSITNEHISANRAFPFSTTKHTASDFILPIDASYEVDLWGRVRRSIALARDEMQATAADLQNVRLSLQAEVASDYYELRSLDLQKQILDDTIVAYQKALVLTTNRFEGGVAPKTEVAQAQTQLDQTRAQDIDVSVARAQFEHAIAILIGKIPAQFSLPVAPLNQAPPAIPVGLPSLLLERRPDIAAAERRMAEANEQIGIARAAYFPQLIIGASGGFEGNSITNWLNWPSRIWAVGPQLSQTLYDGGRRRAVTESALASYDATVATYRETSLNAFQEVEDNLAALRILEQEAKTQHSATMSAENSVDLSTNRYKGGLVTYLEVITEQTISLTNQRTEADILRRRMDASVLLIRALGGGWDVSQLPQS